MLPVLAAALVLAGAVAGSLFSFSRRGPPKASEPWHIGPAEQASRDPVLRSEARVRALTEYALRMGISEEGELRLTAVILGRELARTPYGHSQLRRLLKSAEADEVAFAAQILFYSTDLADLPLLLGAAEENIHDERIVRHALRSVEELLGSIGYVDAENIRELHVRKQQLAKLRAKLEQHQRMWKGKTYVEFWDSAVRECLQHMLRNDCYDAPEAFSQSWYRLLDATDAKAAAPVIIKLILDVDPDKEGHLLPDYIRGLQLYVGPLDIPPYDDRAALRQAQQTLKVWWQANRSKEPLDWLLDRLAQRGYKTGCRDDIQATSAGLIRAMEEGTESERFAATKALSYMLPDGHALIVDHAMVGTIEEENRELITPVQRYLRYLALCRAYEWHFAQLLNSGSDGSLPGEQPSRRGVK